MEYTPETVARMWWSLYGEIPASILESDPEQLYSTYKELTGAGGDALLKQEGFSDAWQMSIYLHNWDKEPSHPCMDDDYIDEEETYDD